MTTPLTKPIRREVKIGGLPYVVELAAGGIMFRIVGSRKRHVVPLTGVLMLALENTRREERREQLRAAVLQRNGR